MIDYNRSSEQTKLLYSRCHVIRCGGCLQNNMSKPLKMETIDSSSGVLLPYYDYDTRIMFLAGKVMLTDGLN